MSEVPTTTPEPRPFNPAALIGGLLLALVIGAGANVIAGLIAMSGHNAILAFFIGTLPGGAFILWGALLGAKRSAFGLGLLIGGCIVALVGGACGAAMVGTSFK